MDLKFLKLKLVFSLFSSCFCLFFKSFSQRRICKLSLFCCLLWSDGNIYDIHVYHNYKILTINYIIINNNYKIITIRYSCLSIFPDDNADIFAASLLTLYCNFACLMSSSIIMINFIFFPKYSFEKVKGFLMQE